MWRRYLEWEPVTLNKQQLSFLIDDPIYFQVTLPVTLSPCHCALVAVRSPIFPARSCRGRYERTAPSEVRGVTRGAFTAAAGKSCCSADSFMPFTSDGFPDFHMHSLCTWYFTHRWAGCVWSAWAPSWRATEWRAGLNRFLCECKAVLYRRKRREAP